MAQERGRRKELRRAGVAAAREARAVLAEAVAALDGDAARGESPMPPRALEARARAIAEAIARAVAGLYRCEIGEPEAVRDRLRESAAALGAVLQDLHAPGLDPLLDVAGPLVARSLAILHPARAELDRELTRSSSPPPLTPLASASPPTAPVGALAAERSRDASDRRAQPRVRLDAEVGAHTRSHFFTGRAGDLSTGGLFVATARPLPVGTELTLGLVLPDGAQVVVEGTVSWVRGPDAGAEGMGVRFGVLDPEIRAALERNLA